MLSAICGLVKKGLSVSHAAEKLHVHHSTVGRWRRELPDFDTAILASEAEFIDSQIANIREAAKKNWQASAWLLERKWPQFFSQPQVQLNMSGPKVEFEDLAAMQERLSHSPAFIELMESSQKPVEGKEIPPALPVQSPAAKTEHG
jgi:hypothetical protein